MQVSGAGMGGGKEGQVDTAQVPSVCLLFKCGEGEVTDG